MAVLGLDVCSGACSVAAVEGDRVLAAMAETMKRGHAERLAPMTAELLETAGIEPASLEGIAVTTGPGSFTGARLGVAFARGLALATGCRAVGLSLFEVLAAEHDLGDGAVVVVLPGKNGSFLLQTFVSGSALAPAVEAYPASLDRAVPREGLFTIIGGAASGFSASLSGEAATRARRGPDAQVTATAVARLGAMKLRSGSAEAPTPLYIRAPDATPPAAMRPL